MLRPLFNLPSPRSSLKIEKLESESDVFLFLGSKQFLKYHFTSKDQHGLGQANYGPHGHVQAHQLHEAQCARNCPFGCLVHSPFLPAAVSQKKPLTCIVNH